MCITASATHILNAFKYSLLELPAAVNRFFERVQVDWPAMLMASGGCGLWPRFGRRYRDWEFSGSIAATCCAIEPSVAVERRAIGSGPLAQTASPGWSL